MISNTTILHQTFIFTVVRFEDISPFVLPYITTQSISEMPSHKADSTLIKLHTLNVQPGTPWFWPQWQEITGIKHGLFPSDDSLLPGGWTRDDANDIAAYFTQYSLLDSEDNKIRFAVNNRPGPHVPGQQKWHNFVSKHWEKWRIHSIISQVFWEQLIHPITLIIDQGSLEPWPNAEIYIPLALDKIGLALFGVEAFDGRDLLPMELQKCVTIFAQRSWTQIRAQVYNDTARLDKLEKATIEAFESTISCTVFIHFS